jgi:hypothetical protein
MPKKKIRFHDKLVSLYGVPFEEALSGVLAAKPPEEIDETKKDGRKKKAPAAPKD